MRRSLIGLLVSGLSMMVWGQGGVVDPSSHDTPSELAAPSVTEQPLGRFLKRDGTLDLPADAIQGSFNPSGYRLVSGPGEPPRFEAAEGNEGPNPRVEGDENWAAMCVSAGVNNQVLALAWDGANLYAGGAFTVAGGVPVNYIAMWDGNAWSALGSGMDNYVLALTWQQGYLYAGGHFHTAGGVAAHGIAKWDGNAWSALGGGMNGSVYAFAWDNANLYAGGAFNLAGGVAANRIAKWDGSTWSALGPGLSNGQPFALAWDGSNLYAGGNFTIAGGTLANKIARWDGSAWSALETGMNSYVVALAWDGSNLFAGGNFTIAGETSANMIAKWDGSAWSALETGMNSCVNALAWDGTNLYAGGDFTSAGGGTANRIAKWDGSGWISLGSGANSNIEALSFDGVSVWVGGQYTTVGGKCSRYIGRWCPPLPAAMGVSATADFCDKVRVSWISVPGAASYSVLRGTTCGTVLDTFKGVSSPFDDTTASPGTTYQYWVVAINPCGGAGEISSCVSGGRQGPPPSPLSVTATTDRCNEVRVTWSSVTGTTSYNVFRGTTCGTALDSFTGVTSPFDDTTVSLGTTYQYWVVAVNDCGSASSLCVAGARLDSPPRPTGVSATTNRCINVRVTWDSATGVASYNVLRGETCGTALITFTNVTSPFDDTSASPGASYQYWIVAVNACGSTNSSCVAGAIPSGPPGTFAQTSPPDGQSSCTVNPTFYWNAAPGASIYTVYLNSTPVEGCQGIAATQCTASGLIENTSYSWKVRAYSCTSLSTYSATWSITTGYSQNIPLDLANDLRASHAGGNVNLDWSLMGTPGPQTTHYHIYRSAAPGAAFPAAWILLDGVALTQTYADLTAGDEVWFYDVRSANDCDNICPAP